VEPVLATHRLAKRYGGAYRVKDVNLAVHEGDIYGFLGPNGAGKTTTLKMILGLVRPTKGRVTVFGKDMEKHRRDNLRNIGALIESPSYYGHLTGLENLRVVQKLRDLPDRNVAEALAVVRLDKHKDRKVDQYSLGMKQRLGIAMALLSFPKLLILDEPTNGLDPAGIGEIRELIKSLPGRYGMTVLISSHLLAEIEQIATSVGIIRDGAMLFQGSLETLKAKSRPAILMKTRNNRLALDILLHGGYAPTLRDEPGGDCLAFDDLPDDEVARINRKLVENGLDVLRIEERRRTLEDIFLDMTGREGSLQ